MKTHSGKVEGLVFELLNWFSTNARDLPWRWTQDPYAVWISEIMLQQTQVKTVIPYFNRWIKRLPDVQSLANAPLQTVLKLWEGLGYYSRARNAQAAAQIIVRQYGGVFPSKFEDILALPGIGRYTAGAIGSIAFNLPVPILDGNVARVLSRVFGIEGDIKSKPANTQLWDRAEQMVRAAPFSVPTPVVSDCALQIAENFKFNAADFQRRTGAISSTFSQRQHGTLNQALMELGALVCVPSNPQCDACPVQSACFAFRKKRVADFPATVRRPATIRRRFMAFVIEKDGQYWVRQRPGGGVNAHLWEFPNVEVSNKAADLNRAAHPHVIEAEPFCRIEHSITRHRILLEAFRATGRPQGPGQWRTPVQLRKLPFTAAHGKILKALETGHWQEIIL